MPKVVETHRIQSHGSPYADELLGHLVGHPRATAVGIDGEYVSRFGERRSTGLCSALATVSLTRQGIDRSGIESDPTGRMCLRIFFDECRTLGFDDRPRNRQSTGLLVEI